MNLIRNALQAVAMIYSLFYYLVAALRLLWLLFVLIGAGIPWLLLAAVAVWCTSKVLQLRHRSTSIASSVDGSASKSLASRPLDRLLVTAPHRNLQHSPAVEPKSSPANGDAHSGGLYWPVAHRGADLDAPENSLAALRMCHTKRCQMVLLDLTITPTGELVILNPNNTKLMTNYTDGNRPNENGHQSAEVLTLAQLLQNTDDQTIVFLLLSTSTKPMLDALRSIIESNGQIFRDRIVMCSESIYALYKLRKMCPSTVCGLWIHKQHSATSIPAGFNAVVTNTNGSAQNTAVDIAADIVGNQTAFESVTSLLLRLLVPSAMLSMVRNVLHHLLVPAVGISVVFVSKEEFNTCINKSWLSAGVRPIVYPVNSPNEKLYFQRNLRTQYLTGSLRTEPQCLLAGKNAH